MSHATFAAVLSPSRHNEDVISDTINCVAHFLFADESGHDDGPSPYGVLGGITIADRDVWNLIKAIQDAEILHFGRRYSVGHGELKAKKLVSAQVFRKAALAAPNGPPSTD